tara:strand:- start:6497 stop:6724 length:228 start_codon:yes stop_codon:yes gene_type:complete
MQKALVAHARVDQPAVPRVVDAQMLQKLVKLVFLGEFERTLEAVGFVFHRREVTRMRRGREKEGSATSRVKFHAI